MAITFNGKQHDHFFMDGQKWHSANYFPKKYKFGKNPGERCMIYAVKDDGILHPNGYAAWAVCNQAGTAVTETWVDNIVTQDNKDYAMVKVVLDDGPGSWQCEMAYVKMSDFGGVRRSAKPPVYQPFKVVVA
ncbi:hypothetical protein OZX69_03040 [Lactobacillus sp. ESL0731]|uniref:hypothetical protein n=1 Tax=unclassified Lactobacillus TaxID=2620435 RepID=UPI0023F908C3|nr:MULTISPECIES: hypothetical protein [unclassified Lactobacillus]WEV51685.1 hypothetical protein OZX63_03040 [Lactobacillus sp. ESL0700]WEV62814.1 hypothetical protein OZX69_03040 [Lactobacillus sp. ESL0731]